MGRTWEEWLQFLVQIKAHFHLSANRRLPIYVHFLSFEFQFFRNFVTVESVFARKKRVPLTADVDFAFQFRCSYYLSNMSLDKLIKNTPNAKFNKQSGKDFDYRKLRLPTTKLSEEELGYCYCDVRGLSEAIQHYLLEDNMATMPMTSTGFLRREVRREVLSNPDNIALIKKCALTPAQYQICKEASRGGNTHANAIYSNMILYDMKSKDRKSSYPAEMIVGDFPVTPFTEISPSEENLGTIINDYKASLIRLKFYNIKLKKIACMPYISSAKCRRIRDALYDNGRVSSAAELEIIITDVDYKIIDYQYDWSEMEIFNISYAEYGKLPIEFRNKLMDMFKQKELLNPDKNPNADPYLYAKFKNKINAYFGMMLTDICSPEIIYHVDADEAWTQEEPELFQALSKHYTSRRTFLTYQHGVWVTAQARWELQLALNAVDEDAVYCDTDSVKYLENHDNDFKRLNEIWLAKCERNDIKPYVEVYGKRIYLGTWEDDGTYSEFKTLGAKKYAYVTPQDDSIHITVAGLNKKDGANFLNKLAKDNNTTPIEEFKIGTIIPEEFSGRTTAYYNDYKQVEKINIEGTEVILGSNIAVVNTTYKFGLSDDYIDYLLGIETRKEENYNEDNY